MLEYTYKYKYTNKYKRKYKYKYKCKYKYDKESEKGYTSVTRCPQNSDASWDVENRLSTWFSEYLDAQLSEYV